MCLDELSRKRKNWQSAEDELVRRLRLRHRSFSTEKTYLGWLRRFATYLRKSAKGVSRQRAVKAERTLSRSGKCDIVHCRSDRVSRHGIKKSNHVAGITL